MIMNMCRKLNLTALR